MKKIIFIAFTGFGLLLSSCKKETIEEKNQNSNGKLCYTYQATQCADNWVIFCGTPPLPPIVNQVEMTLNYYGIEPDTVIENYSDPGVVCTACNCPSSYSYTVWIDTIDAPALDTFDVTGFGNYFVPCATND